VNNIENKLDHVLGKTVEYKFIYDPDILVRIPRCENRKLYGFDNTTVPWTVGHDLLHAYECSFMLENGLPVNGVLKLVFPATSEFIVESKSLKLYLFSFNMQILGKIREEAIARFQKTVETDLGNLLETQVHSCFYTEADASRLLSSDSLLGEAHPLESMTSNLESLTFDKFNEDPTLLQFGTTPGCFIYSDMLRSNCKITHQPDWGTIYVYIYGMKEGIDMDSLAQYIVSFRGENHFHEEIVECMYARLWEKYKPFELMVTALYTRRGGIDICPTRASKPELLPQQLIDANILTLKDYRQ
jgi:7-cyano-7-deazaguanine reductase